MQWANRSTEQTEGLRPAFEGPSFGLDHRPLAPQARSASSPACRRKLIHRTMTSPIMGVRCGPPPQPWCGRGRHEACARHAWRGRSRVRTALLTVTRDGIRPMHESPIDAGGKRSGQSRSYVRPATRQLPLAIMGVRLRARHHSGRRARGTTPCSVSPGLSRPQPFPSRRSALPAGPGGLAPATYQMLRDIMPLLLHRP